MQKLDYKQLPLKYKTCHKYGHFAKDYKKNIPQAKAKPAKEEQWKIVKKNLSSKPSGSNQGPFNPKQSTSSSSNQAAPSHQIASSTPSSATSAEINPLISNLISSANRFGILSQVQPIASE